MASTQVVYSDNNDPFNSVLVKSDNSFVVVGENVPSDADIQKMVDWQDVDGWSSEWIG